MNTRVATSRLTGVPRYANELARLLEGRVSRISPNKNAAVGTRGHIWEQLALPMVVKQDLLFSPANTGPLGVAKQVVTIHDWSVIDHPEWYTQRFAKWYGFLLPKLVRRVRHVIAVSKFTEERILEATGVSKERVTVIPNGIDGRFSPRPEEEIAAVRHALGLPSTHYLLSLCTLEPRKNLQRMIDAWRIVHKKLPDDVWLVLAGAWGASTIFRIRELPALPPRVFITGYVRESDLAPLYSGALAFVYPSLYEGFGLPPLEAMACGTPVLCSNAGALAEVVGDACFTVDPLDVEDIAYNIGRLVSDGAVRSRLRRKGLERPKRFSWELAAERTWRVLSQAVS